MKNLVLFTFLFFSFAIFSTLSAQGDSDLRDNNIRMRSNDLERTKRDAQKPDVNPALQMNAEIEKKFTEIKEDYEGMQRAQESVVKAYTTGKKINYEQIEKSAKAVNENAQRLNSNLFTKEAKDKKSEKNADSKEKDVKELIVELDNVIGRFVSSAMFQNLRVVDQKVADKAQTDLAEILKISGSLSRKAGKLK